MASANALGYILPIGVGSVAVAGGMSLAHVDMKKVILNFVTGPGRTSRILLAFFVVTNWKNMPFMWTVWHPSLSPIPSKKTHLLPSPSFLQET